MDPRELVAVVLVDPRGEEPAAREEVRDENDLQQQRHDAQQAQVDVEHLLEARHVRLHLESRRTRTSRSSCRMRKAGSAAAARVFGYQESNLC